MEERSASSSHRIVMLKKGEHVPSNASQLSESEILDIQFKRIEDFTPHSEMKIFQYSPHFIGLSVAFSGVIINGIYRKNFRLGGLKMMLTYAPSTVLPAILSVGVHETVIKQRILLGQEPCSSCLTVKSGIFQASMGVLYPCLVSALSCLPVAREYYTLPMPTAQKGMGYLRLLRQVSPSVNVLLLLGAFNILVGVWVSSQELEKFLKHFSKPPSPPDALLDKELFNEGKTFE